MHISRFFVLLGFLSFVPISVLAQEAPTVTPEQTSPTKAVVSGPLDIAVGRTIVLDASLSTTQGEEVTYAWYLGEETRPISTNVEAVFTPEEPGELTFRLVVTTVLNDEEITSETVHFVTVFRRKIVLITDDSVPQDKLLLHEESAKEAGTYLLTLKPSSTSAPLAMEEMLVNLLSERRGVLQGADAIVVWTEGITGLQALLSYVRGDSDLLAGINNQTIILISGSSLQRLARTTHGPFSVLEPRQILVTRKEAINPLLSAETMETFQADIEQRDIDFLIVDRSSIGIRPWNLVTSLVNYMLTNGVSSETVILLLMLPVIATILAFLKQFVGITTFGLYTPSIIALSMLALGWRIGILFLLFIILTGYLTRSAMRRWRLLYIPKVAIILTVVSFTLLCLLGIGAYFGITFSRDTIFILLIMSTLAESFLNLKTEAGLYSAMLGIGETIGAALLCVFIVQWPFLQSVILAYPEVILLTIVADVVLGRWTGLRLIEYFRFREVFRHLQEE